MTIGVTSTSFDAQHLSKIWRIDLDAVTKARELNMMQCLQNEGDMSKNYPTNDRTLWYKHICEYFFMDTFFATKKGGKSS